MDDSAPNFAVLDLDLELNLTEADWGAGNDKLSQSQVEFLKKSARFSMYCTH